ncbi:MAG: WGR domain-containing protein, partial [Candidatus Altiarchaeales archaeon]|nr:WGR domain-containing protein [Candidatus Altiarchaeales archaeon]
MSNIVKVHETDTVVNQSGKHNKFYTVSVVELDNGNYETLATYGPIDGWRKTLVKCSSPSIGGARHKMQEILSEKRQKGYISGPSIEAPTVNGVSIPMSVPGNTGTHRADGSLIGSNKPTKPTSRPAAQVTPSVPPLSKSCQLLTEIDKDRALELVQDPDYCAQEKHDGKRMKLVWEGEQPAPSLQAINKKGLLCGGPMTFRSEFETHFDGLDMTLDGEQVGKHYWTWDIMSLRGQDIRYMPYRERLSQLEYEASTNSEFIHVVETAYTTVEKAALFQALIEGEKEGIVFKRLDAPYTDGKGGPQYKFKFYATASVIVLKQNAKRSVEIGVLDGSPVVSVGNCTIPPNKDVPQAGDIVEIRYLYAYKGGSLYQPTYLGPRDDIYR